MGINRKQIAGQNKISDIYTFSLGKVPQKVLIEGKSKELPIVINLHGGPASPIPFSVYILSFLLTLLSNISCAIAEPISYP